MELNPQAASWDELRSGFRWQLPERYNLASACCGRWAADRARFALYYETAAGRTQAWTFWDIQRAANRLSNVLAALGTMRGDRVAILLPQRPEAGIAHIACYQMGAIVVALPGRLAPAELERRIADTGARVAIVDQAALERLAPLRDRLPALRQMIGVGGAREAWVREWDELLPLASARYAPVDTAADDPALIVASDASLGAVMAQRALLGNLPGFICAHGFYPQPEDMFWSPVDWADAPFGTLLPAWNFGQPLLACDGGFDPERAFALMAKYGVRNALLAPAHLEALMAAPPATREQYDLGLRSLVTDGLAGDQASEWARAAFGVAVSANFGQAEFGALIGSCGSVLAAKPGALGRAYPGRCVALLDAAGQPAANGEICVRRRCHDDSDPALFIEYWQNPQATRDKFFGAGADAWGRTGVLAEQDEDGCFRYRGRLPAASAR